MPSDKSCKSTSQKAKVPTQKSTTPRIKDKNLPVKREPTQLTAMTTKHIDADIVSSKTTSTQVRKQATISRIIVRFNCGFPNNLYLRGDGAKLSWDKGTLMKNINTDEWIWETVQSFETLQFKVLINDTLFECGENHTLEYGTSITVFPTFN